MFRRILVGWDGSPEAGHALRTAIDLAADVGADVVAIAVHRPPHHVETTEDRAAALQADRQQTATGLAPHRAQAAASGVNLAEGSIEGAPPGEMLAAHAAEHGFDMLVVGRGGAGRGGHPGLGRVTDHLVRHAPCPVLVVGS